MQTPELIFETTPAFLLIFAGIAVAVAWYFYRKDQKTWSLTIRRVLFGLRSVLMFFLLALILSPLLKYLANETDPPISVIVLDNSESISSVMESTEIRELIGQIEQLKNVYGSDHEVYLTDLNVELLPEGDSLNFNYNETDLHNTFRLIESKFESRNVKSVILVSDGIYNSGISPTYFEYDFEIHTVGIGDTTRRKDIAIRDVQHNQVTYQGNRFPVQVEVFNEGFQNESAVLSLYHLGRLVESKSVQFNQERESQEFIFLVNAEEKGNQRYRVDISTKEEEFNKQNNSRDIFIEIVEGKENILILSRFPDPDIRAIRAAIENNPNYTIELFISGLTKNQPQEKSYDLLVLNKIFPDDNVLTGLSGINTSNTARLMLLGGRMNYSRLNEFFSIRFNAIPGEFDMVTPAPNTAFSHFSTSPELNTLMSKLPPVKVPFGDIAPSMEMESLLFQRVGSISTEKPLFLFGNEEPKTGIFLGEGLWRWRMHDYLTNDSHEHFDELIQKSIQFLSTKNDTRKLRVRPLADQSTGRSVVLETELYNELFERIYNVPIQLTVENENGEKTEFQYSTSENNSRYRLSGLRPGIYNYVARAEIGNNMETASGQFVLKETRIEQVELTADHELLKSLAQQNNGIFVTPENIENLESEISSREYPAVLRSQETFEPVINIFWILLILISFATVEWFLRKYYGGY